MLRSSPPLAVPFDLSSFVGREDELSRLAAALDEARLITLTGAGGSGKTRLALELLKRLKPTQPVVWVELADATDASSLLHRLGQATQAGADARSLEAVLDAVPDDALVGLDNCEHLIDAAARVAAALLARRPGTRVLATSREPLGLPGERAWRVPPLAVDGCGEVPEAVRLFVERAREVRPGFELGPENRDAVVAICRDLGGIPLAIELAAARTRILSPVQIQSRLHEALDLLSRGGRTAVPRHRTLRATLDWSHELLDDESARLLHRLAVFQGGASLEGVEAVGGDEGADPLDTLEALTRLADRSWVTVREGAGVARYHLLETVRMYAAEHLAASGESDFVHRRHAGFILASVEEARPHFTGPGRRAWVERLTPELPNLRAALRWTLQHDPEVHLRLAASLWWFWFSSRHWEEARHWLEGAVALPSAATRDRRRAELLFALGALDALQGRSAEARPWLHEALEIATELGADALAAYVRVYLGMSLAQERDPDAERFLEPARDWLAERGDLYLLRLAQILLGSAYASRGDMPAALEVTRAGVATARVFGQDRELGISLQALGILLYQAGDLDEARERLLESLAALERDPSIMFVARTLHFLALCTARAGGRDDEAARMLAVAEVARAGIGASVVSIDAGTSETDLTALRDRLGDARFRAAHRQAATIELASVVRSILETEETAPAEPGRRSEDSPSEAAGPERPAAPPPGPREPAEAGSPPDLEVRLLGGFEAAIGGEPVPASAWPYARPRELLALLALHPEGRSREQIAAALWPMAAPAQARNSVHVTLHHLRKALGRPEWIELDDGRYRVAPSVGVDVDAVRFASVARRPDAGIDELRSALALYRGDLLEGEVAGRWVEDHADPLRRLYRDLVLRVGGVLEERGDDDEAEALYSGLVKREELDEELHRRLMAMWSRRGDRTRALAHFGRFADLLRTEMEAEPEPATLELVTRLRTGTD